MVETARAAAAHKELRRLYDSYWNFLEPAGPGVGGTSFIILILILILILIYHWRRPRLFTFFPAHTGPFINLPRRRPPGQEAGRTCIVRALSSVVRTFSSVYHSTSAAAAGQLGELFEALAAGLDAGDAGLPGRGVAVLTCGPPLMQVLFVVVDSTLLI